MHAFTGKAEGLPGSTWAREDARGPNSDQHRPPSPGSNHSPYVANELVANAVEHAGGPLGVAVSRTGHIVRVAVIDGSDDLPILQVHNPLARRGRGLQVVNGLALNWGCSVHDFGKKLFGRT